MIHLINSALRPSTRLSYAKTWKNFILFLDTFNFSTDLPIDDHAVALYITQLWRSKLKTSSIRTYLSAISYFHKIHRHRDPTCSYFVKQVLKGASRCNTKPARVLKPLSKIILLKIIPVIDKMYDSKYVQSLYKALITFSYFACLRAGEAVVSTCNTHTLRVDDIAVDSENSIVINFRSYKHCASPCIKFVLNLLPNSNICPVQNIVNFLNLRNHAPGPLFIFSDGTPVTRTHYSEFIKNAVNFKA